MPDDIRDTIAMVAHEEGIDPSYALAVADRESSFNPNARNSKSIEGLYQMTGANRQQYGYTPDVEGQTRAFARFTKDLQGEMAGTLGRAPTNAETYLGHFWGGNRAARVIAGGQSGMAPQDVFSPREMAENPELARGSSVGGVAGNVMADIDRRQAKYGGAPDNSGNNRANTDFASYGDPKGFDFAQYGQAADDPKTTLVSDDSAGRAQSRPGTEIDLSQFGAAQAQPQTDFSTFGASQPQPQATT